jgi:hypothetical protein
MLTASSTTLDLQGRNESSWIWPRRLRIFDRATAIQVFLCQQSVALRYNTRISGPTTCFCFTADDETSERLALRQSEGDVTDKEGAID